VLENSKYEYDVPAFYALNLILNGTPKHNKMSTKDFSAYYPRTKLSLFDVFNILGLLS